MEGARQAEERPLLCSPCPLPPPPQTFLRFTSLCFTLYFNYFHSNIKNVFKIHDWNLINRFCKQNNWVFKSKLKFLLSKFLHSQFLFVLIIFCLYFGFRIFVIAIFFPNSFTVPDCFEPIFVYRNTYNSRILCVSSYWFEQIPLIHCHHFGVIADNFKL